MRGVWGWLEYPAKRERFVGRMSGICSSFCEQAESEWIHDKNLLLDVANGRS
jgi:hypothetical protein